MQALLGPNCNSLLQADAFFAVILSEVTDLMNCD